MKFKDLDLHLDLLEGLEAMGFENATPIQEKAIPIIKKNKDLIGCAQTGTGKTAAFLLPVMDQIIRSGTSENLSVLIITPTRELAIQIDQQIQGLSYYTSINSIAIYGGSDGDMFTQEKAALTQGAPIVVATVGRLLSHIKMGYVKFDSLKVLILDEADRMLDMGFYDDIISIIKRLPQERQNLFFSATMPRKAEKLAEQILKEPEEVKIEVSKPSERIVQLAFSVYDTQKIPLIQHILTQKEFKSVITFCSTKDSAKALNRSLKKLDLSVEEIHSDLDQKKRNEILNQFKAKKLNILVATDVISRGIDIEDIDLVINFDIPNDPADYIHRIGRTARASATGIAISLINEKDQRYFAFIEKLLEEPVAKGKLPGDLGQGPIYDYDKLMSRKSYPNRGNKRR